MNKTYYGPPVTKVQNDEAPVSEYFAAYLQMNPATGYLTFEVFNDSPVRGRVPVPNAKITVSKPLGDDYYLSKIITSDANGDTVPLPLPTVSREISQHPGMGRAFSSYNVSVEAPGYLRKDVFDVQIFEGITSVQRVPLAPSGSGREGNPAGTTRISRV